MAEEKPKHHLFHSHKEEQKPAAVYSESTIPAAYSESAYPTGDGPKTDYKEEEKRHGHLEQLRDAGADSTILHAKQDQEHAHRHKIEEEVAAAPAVGSGGFAFHEKHEKKETKKEEGEAHGKKHHHIC